MNGPLDQPSQTRNRRGHRHPVAVGAPDQRNPPQRGAAGSNLCSRSARITWSYASSSAAPRSSRRSAISSGAGNPSTMYWTGAGNLVGEPATQRRMVGHQSGQRVPEPWWVERPVEIEHELCVVDVEVLGHHRLEVQTLLQR